MSALVPFESAKLPAHIRNFFQVSDELASGAKSGFPVISIKGKVFHISRGDEKVLVTKPNDPDEPASNIEVVIIKTHPGLAKTFYASGYVEGSAEKPNCYSNDGVAPAADAVEPQAKKCAVCPHNQWGSRVTDEGKKGKACSDVKRLAVSPAGQLNDPMLLRVPAASLKTLDAYNDMLKKRGVPYQAVVTKIGFDYTVAHPALTFRAVNFISDEMAREVIETAKSTVVEQIVGSAQAAAASRDDEEFEQRPAAVESPTKAETKAAAPAVEPPVTAPKKASRLAAVSEEAEAAPKAKVQVEAGEPEPEAPAPKRSAPVEVDDPDLKELLDGLGFDD